MEVTAVCLSLVTNALMLLVAQIQRGYYAQKSDPAVLSIVPNRLQVFEYERISFNCVGLDGSSGWRVMRRINRTIYICASNWETSKESSCTIRNVYATDNGEYWCENGIGKRSHAVNIAVADGTVVLESPVLAVMGGRDVTLRCKTKTTPSNLTADFYKDGFRFGSSSTREMTIHNVSKSDEGFYKCSVSENEVSPKSWLAVRGLEEKTQPSLHCSTYLIHVMWGSITGLLAALLLAVGLLHLWKSREAREANPVGATYAVVSNHRRNRGRGRVLDPYDVCTVYE